MKRVVLALGALLMAASLTAPAEAASPGVATATANIRSGPGLEYPPIGMVPAGAPVFIHGCLGGWIWCDMSWGQVRGWVHGPYLAAHYQGRHLAVAHAAPYIGVPVVSFHIGSYWDRHYRTRSFYRDRHRWERRHHSHRPRYVRERRRGH